MQRQGRIHWLPVFAGFLGDVTISQIIGGIAASIDPNIFSNSLFNSTTGIVIWVLGLMSTVIAGGVAAYFAGEERVLHAVLVAGLGLLLALMSTLVGETISFDGILLTVLAVPLAGLAGYVSRWTPMRSRRRGK